MLKIKNKFTFQSLIKDLSDFWKSRNCFSFQSFDMKVGAGTSHPITCMYPLKKKKISLFYVQPSRRPADGINFNFSTKLQHYYQFQVIIKPSPKNLQNLYLNSLKFIGFNTYENDIQFLEDNWENPTLGAWGTGWEVRINGLEVTQLTYFQQLAGINCNPVIIEITYGLERMSMLLQKKKNIFNIRWDICKKNNLIKYKNIFYDFEFSNFIYNLIDLDNYFVFYCLNKQIKIAKKMIYLNKDLFFSAYEYLIQAIHNFNLINARKLISDMEKKRYILVIKDLITKITKIYINKL
ncbi:MAG: glycine--tRNA ligase subunit alpha [Enterobacteriaceae bacterium]